MFDLQPFNCLEYLFDLIGFCLAFAVLDVDPWVTNPRGLVHPMTSACLTGLPEIMVAYPAEIGKTNPSRIGAHFSNDFKQACHG